MGFYKFTLILHVFIFPISGIVQYKKNTTVKIEEKIVVSLYLLNVLADNCKKREEFSATAASTASAHLLHQQ